MQMSRPPAILIALLCGIGVCADYSGAKSSGQQRSRRGELAPAPAKSSQAAQSSLRGVSSCTATACHGGRTEGNPSWRSAYTVWVNQDPHAKAYSILHDRRSREIVQRLRGLKTADEAEPWKEQSCLACHTISTGDPTNTSLLGDGVSCEACHGGSGDWLKQHVTQNWTTLSPSQKAARGMVDTTDLRTRAERCVACHVGAPASDGAPARDVNHDLLAAGHPRLTFEFTAYLQNMPPHWDEQTDRSLPRYKRAERGSAEYDNFEARAWAIGQAVTGKAALELLAARASAVDTDNDHATTHYKSPWPEFSEVACYDCHHGLHDSKSRQQQAATRSGGGGLNRWGTWNFPMLEQLAHGDLGIQGELDLLPARSAMSALLPEPGRVLPAAQSASDQAGRFIEHLVRQNYRVKLPVMLSGVLAAWARDANSTEHRHDWDRMAQYYLAAVALHNAVIEGNRGMLTASDGRVQKLLREIRAALRFSDQANSPEDFNADAVSKNVEALDTELRQALGQR